MSCNGISLPDTKQPASRLPTLFVTRFTLRPGAVLQRPSSSSDCLVVGVNGGDLINDSEPSLHVSLEKDSVTLMPKKQPFRLRNKSRADVEFRLVEIRRQ